MNSLESYIALLKEKTKDYNEIEKIRYVYIDLGRKMTFDLNFAFGNDNIREDIYRSCFYNIERLNEHYENKTIICKSLAYLLEYILESLGINIITSVDDHEINGYKHVNNMIKLSDNTIFMVDLQRDLENIQAHLKTKYFGLTIDENKEIIDSLQLRDVDLKIGYIASDKYYSDEYYYLMKQVVDSFTNLNDKVAFILNNFDPYDDYINMNYAEYRWYFVHNMFKYLNDKEKRKIDIFDMYYVLEYEKKYVMAIFINDKHNKNIYLYNDESNIFECLTIEKFKDKLKKGLNSVRELPRRL